VHIYHCHLENFPGHSRKMEIADWECTKRYSEYTRIEAKMFLMEMSCDSRSNDRSKDVHGGYDSSDSRSTFSGSIEYHEVKRKMKDAQNAEVEGDSNKIMHLEYFLMMSKKKQDKHYENKNASI